MQTASSSPDRPLFSRRAAFLGLGLALTLSLVGCLSLPQFISGSSAKPNVAGGATVQSIALTDVVLPAASDKPVEMAAARNEWTSFAIQLNNVSMDGQYTLRLRPLKKGDAVVPATIFEPYQIRAMPVDVNRAGYVRHTGLSAAVRELPRALLPVAHDNGLINLQTLRAPAGPLQLWVDVHVPETTAPGDYAASCDLISVNQKEPVASLPVKLTVYDFVIPNERHLQVVGRMSWDSLKRIYPERFKTVRPQLLNRGDEKYAATIKIMDQLITLAQRHRTTVVVPRLQPTVKWPAGQAPEVDWSDFDSVAGPWLTGTMFPDHTPLTFWPLPSPDYLDQFDLNSRNQYWLNAAQHFDQNDWLGRSPVWLTKSGGGPAIRAGDVVDLSARAAESIAVHPRVRVTVPLENDQLQLTSPAEPNMIDPAVADRVWAAAPGLVFTPPLQSWAGDPKKLPEQWLRTDVPGLVPYIGAGGDEHDVRLWAWLSFLRNAKLIIWNGVLPSDEAPGKPADPNELIWFYPGEWFGVAEPVPTIQLKWLRRCEQDYEYLRLAKERGEVLNALVMARLMTKPVEIRPGQDPDPAYALMCGTADSTAWTEGQKLLAQTILLREAGKEPDPNNQHALYIQTLHWMQPQERPLLMGRETKWGIDILPDANGKAALGDRLSLKVGIDVYNASDTRPDKNHLQWSAVPQGFEAKPQPIDIPALATYQVRRETMEATFDLKKISPGTPQPAEMNFIDGFTNRVSPLQLVIPVGATERVEGRRLAIDGKLDEWDDADLIQNGPMVRMLTRPLVQQQQIAFAEKPAKIYTGWAEDDFYLAFDLNGIAREELLKGSQNFVNYQFNRAWGEDLAEVIIQPIYANTQVGPVLHLVCKPTGHWVERKTDARMAMNPWQPFEGAGIRYKAVMNADNWKGEVSIPWNAISEAKFGRPVLLRFNFVQHRTATGESASWAGPVDFGRDDTFTGILHVREVTAPGPAPVVDGQDQRD